MVHLRYPRVSYCFTSAYKLSAKSLNLNLSYFVKMRRLLIFVAKSMATHDFFLQRMGDQNVLSLKLGAHGCGLCDNSLQLPQDNSSLKKYRNWQDSEIGKNKFGIGYIML